LQKIYRVLKHNQHGRGVTSYWFELVRFQKNRFTSPGLMVKTMQLLSAVNHVFSYFLLTGNHISRRLIGPVTTAVPYVFSRHGRNVPTITTTESSMDSNLSNLPNKFADLQECRGGSGGLDAKVAAEKANNIVCDIGHLCLQDISEKEIGK
jgi:hypothetical protein